MSSRPSSSPPVEQSLTTSLTEIQRSLPPGQTECQNSIWTLTFLFRSLASYFSDSHKEGMRVKALTSALLVLQASLVHTAETIRIRFFMDMLMDHKRPVMLVGNAGSGKSVLMGDKLRSLSTDHYVVQSVPFNFYTTSAMLQGTPYTQRHRSWSSLEFNLKFQDISMYGSFCQHVCFFKSSQ